MFNSIFGLAMFIFFCWLLFYATVDRICRCIDEAAMAKAIAQLGKSGISVAELAQKVEELKSNGGGNE